MDLQPDEERLVAYAVDQATEVKAEVRNTPQHLVAVKIVKGIMQTTRKLRETKTYLVKNRSKQDRTLIIEHPVRPGWSLVTPDKPTERSRDFYRFQVNLTAGKPLSFPVTDEQSRVEQVLLSSIDDKTVQIFMSSPVTPPKVKEAMSRAMVLRTQLSNTQRELSLVQVQLKAISEDQVRMRANLERLPKDSAVTKRYLDKFDTEETDIEKLQVQIKKLQESEKKQQKDYEDYLAGLTIE